VEIAAELQLHLPEHDRGGGRRAGHVGRQKMPVERTATTKTPS